MRRVAGLNLAALLFAALTALPAAGGAATPERLEATAPSAVLPAQPDSSLRHVASGYHFPAALASMPVRRKAVFAPDDVLVTYSDRGGGNGDPWLDVIVYPARQPIADEAASMVQSLRTNWRVDREAPSPAAPPAARDGISRWFHGEHDGRAMTTGFILVERDGWWIAARASCPDEAGERGIKVLEDALAAIPWAFSAAPTSQAPGLPITG